jgi:hypothetical protein
MRAAAPTLAVLLAALVAPPAFAAAPELDYLLHCQGCHRADGGETPGSVPPLADQVARFLRVPGGREYLVRVPGSSQSSLDDAALARLLNWIVQRFGPADAAAAAAPYTADEVARVRMPPLVDVERVRAELVARMADAANTAR